jgi:hypothetical protein
MRHGGFLTTDGGHAKKTLFLPYDAWKRPKIGHIQDIE